jgi:hypothetical protein
MIDKMIALLMVLGALLVGALACTLEPTAHRCEKLAGSFALFGDCSK